MNTMEYKGFKAQIMRAVRLTGDYAHSLPPGNPIDIYPVDIFEKPLKNWITGQGNYVVPVKSEWGLWFNWTMNDKLNTCILPTVKGMNPITGRRTNGFSLEKYENKCPEHKIEFKDGLYCEKCNFKWPKQNYISYPNTLWWDGFRTSDGKVRQFFFTKDLAKSIPEQVIGKEDTVPAFGFVFYRTKTKRVIKHSGITRGFSSESALGNVYLDDMKSSNNGNIFFTSCSNSTLTLGSAITQDSASPIINCCQTDSIQLGSNGNIGSGDPNPEEKLRITKSAKKLEVGVGAGAEILQDLQVDELKLDDWEESPASVMRLYFIFTDEFKRVSDKGMKDLEGKKEGYLDGLKVG